MSESRSAALLVIVLSLGGACATRRSAATAERGALELHNTPLIHVLETLSRRSGRPVAVEPTAASSAEALRITLLVPAGAADDAVARLLDTAMDSSRLSVALVAHGWVVRRRAPTALPPLPVPPPPPASSDPYPPPAAGDAGTSDAELTGRIAAGVRPVGPDTFEVTPAVRDLLVGNTTLWMRSMRILPRERDGEVVGLVVFGIRPRSIPGILGLLNGDVLTSVNGHRLSSPEQALEAYAAMRGAQHAEIDLERRGQPVRLQYRLARRTSFEPSPP